MSSVPSTVVAGPVLSKVLLETLGPVVMSAALDAMLETGFRWFDQSGGMPIAEQPSGQLAGGITIINNMSSNPTSGASIDGIVMELKNRDDGMPALKSHLQGLEASPSQTLDSRLSSMNDNESRLVGNASNGRYRSPSGLSSTALRAFRSSIRKDTDGSRVSREFHEYQYCLNSGQINTILGQAGVQDFQGHSYGRFVDSPNMRKAIAAWRKIQRLLKSRNVKMVLEMLGNDEADLLDNLIDASPGYTQLVGSAAIEYTG